MSGLTAFAVRRYQFTLIVFLALVALGVQSLFAIPKAEDPTFPLPTFVVVAVLPGATPKDVERLVVDPIETKLKSLDDVKAIKTEIDDGLAVTQVEFLAGVDATRKRDEVLRETTALKPTLPPELVRFEVRQFNATKVNILEVALVSEDAPYALLDQTARALKRRLEGRPGVDEVQLAGLPTREVKVTLDLDRMVALGVSPEELIGAIGGEATNIPAGSVDVGARRFNVKTSGDYGSIDEIGKTVVRTGGGAAIKVADLATVALADAEGASRARFNGKRAVLVAVNQKERQNVFDVQKGLVAELSAFERELPSGVTMTRGFDQSENVSHRLGGFTRDFGIAILLVLVTLLPLGLRASAVVMVSIPLSLAIGLSLLHFAGFTINQLSIVGFVIALGLLVDDSVVVVENITRHLREGLAPREAAIAATKQITVSVLGCTATLIFAFVPLLALPGNAGQFIRSMPVAVVFTIAASLLVSLTVVPFLSSLLLKSEGEHGNVFFRAMTWAIEGSYRRVLERAIQRPKAALLVAAALFAASLALVPHIGFSVFPKAGVPQFLVTVETAPGASLDETDRAVRFVEGVLAGHREVKNVAAVIGKGHPQIYYNVSPKNEKANAADVFAELTGDRKAWPSLLERMRAELRGYPGATLDLKEFENGPPIDAPIAIRLLGDDAQALAKGAAAVESILSGLPGTRDVKNPAKDERLDLRVVVDRDKAALLDVAPVAVDRAVRLAVGGVTAAKYREDSADESYDVRVTLPRPGRDGLAAAARPDLATLDRVYVASARGAAVPLSQVARVALEPSPTVIRHYNKERSVTVTAEVKPGENTDRLTAAAAAKLESLELPPGVRFMFAGEAESKKESFGGLAPAIVVTIFGILAILVLEFRTFKGTLIVASVIPLGVTGGLVALFLSGYTLSFTATVGFIALMGIEVKNSILLVDFTNQLREEGMALDLAIQKAGEARFVPILLTTLTAIGGLVPLVLEGSSLYSPLALVILGGLVSSTLLARVVTPVLYKLLAPAVDARYPAAQRMSRATLAPAE